MEANLLSFTLFIKKEYLCEYMEQLRKLTEAEILELTAAGNSSKDWSGVYVSGDFRPSQIVGSCISGRLILGSGATILYSTVSDYELAAGARVERVGLLECRHRSSFGVGVEVCAVNENAGRSILLSDELTAQIAYMDVFMRADMAVHEALSEMTRSRAQQISSQMGYVGEGSVLRCCRIVREARLAAGVIVEGASLLENVSLLDGCYVGVDVKCRNAVIAQGARIDTGATLNNCFIGENSHVASGFTAVESLIFSSCELENGEACAIFAGPHTVSHHKSSLLIAGAFSFFNAGSGTNQSNHLFKAGAVHQAIHPRGCKFASNAYVMAPSCEGAFTMVMGRHYAHHDTYLLPFSYLVEGNGRSELLPARALLSYGTRRDQAKWPQRDRREYRRDIVDYHQFNPYLLWLAIEGKRELERLLVHEPEAAEYEYNGVWIRNAALRRGIELYSLYIDVALVAALSGGQAAQKPSVQRWIDLGGAYFTLQSVEGVMQDIVSCRFSSLQQLQQALLSKHDPEAGMKALAMEYLGLQSVEEALLAELKLKSEQAALALEKWILEDRIKDESAKMAVGYGFDYDDAEKAMQDFRNVRKL